MLKNHLKLISFGVFTIFCYGNLQASQDKFDDYTSDFLDIDCFSEALSNIDDTMADAKDYQEPDYNDIKCDKREDRDLAEKRYMNEQKRLQKVKELNLLVTKRLHADALPLTISLPSSPEDEGSQTSSNNGNFSQNTPGNSDEGTEFSSMRHKYYSIESFDGLSTHSSASTIFAEIRKQSPEKLELKNIEDDSDHVEL